VVVGLGMGWAARIYREIRGADDEGLGGRNGSRSFGAIV
jgi:hypothetical protein